MEESNPRKVWPVWRRFLRRHWGIIAIFAVAAVLLFVGGIEVFLWFVGNAQSTGLVPSVLILWTMNHLITFFVYLVLWEILLVGIPVIIAGIAGWQWWKRLSEAEKMEFHFPRTKPHKRTGGSGGFSFLIFIAFCIKIYLDGNWNVPIAIWTLNYLVYSMLTALIWVAIIFGIPAAIALIAFVWWLNRKTKIP